MSSDDISKTFQDPSENKNDFEKWEKSLQEDLSKIRRTEDVISQKHLTFSDLHLKPELLRGLYSARFIEPTPVQEVTIPIALMGQHILARAKNGTGKTASYLVPILNRIDTTKPYIQALVLTPTRELTIQTNSVCKTLGAFLNVEVMSCIGGTKLPDDILRLKQPVHVIVATIGRLNDLCYRKECDLSNCTIIALDEADKLLDYDSRDKVEAILAYTSPKRQIMLFSATYPNSIEDFRQQYIPDAYVANLMYELTLKGVTQFYTFVQEKQKIQCLMTLFALVEIKQCVIFCNTVNRVELLAKHIIKSDFPCLYAHARMEQEERNKVFHDFKENKARFLVTSDLFTRGIDNQAVNVVINFDMPSKSETYLNRIGRSGRYGRYGIAISLITDADKECIIRVEKELDTVLNPLKGPINKSLY